MNIDVDRAGNNIFSRRLLPDLMKIYNIVFNIVYAKPHVRILYVVQSIRYTNYEKKQPN